MALFYNDLEAMNKVKKASKEKEESCEEPCCASTEESSIEEKDENCEKSCCSQEEELDIVKENNINKEKIQEYNKKMTERFVSLVPVINEKLFNPISKKNANFIIFCTLGLLGFFLSFRYRKD